MRVRASPSARPLTPRSGLLCPAASITFQLRRGRPTHRSHGGQNNGTQQIHTTADRPEAQEATAPEPKAREAEQVTITGRLCADPVLRHTKSGKAVTTIRLAVNDGREPRSTRSWSGTAAHEVVCEYLRKGRRSRSGRPQERTCKPATAATATRRDHRLPGRVPLQTRPPGRGGGGIMTAPRIYVACLAAYNAGRLHGGWIDANQSG